jgi:NADH:ubiquinone oxidoreductase subunit E
MWIMPGKEAVMVELSVCIGSACHLKGSYNVIQTFQQLIEEKSLHDKIVFKLDFCMKECRFPGVGIILNGERHHVAAEKAGDFFTQEVEPKLHS